jgi:RNA ligase
MLLNEYLDTEKLKRYVQSGHVEAHYHKTFPLVLYTYGRPTVWENLWDDVTTKTRTLIINTQTGEIVARGFEKFHNIDTGFAPETHLRNLPKDAPLVTDKLDGSLGVLYRWDGNDYIASKGSFHSDHSDWANRFYREHYRAVGTWPQGWTPIFEMICEGVQHHIVHYGYEALVLLAIIHNDTGEEMPYDELVNYSKSNGIPVVGKFNKSVTEMIAECPVFNEVQREGYVASWPRLGQPPLKVKIKFMDFLRLQKIINGITVRRIFEAVSQPPLNSYLTEWLDPKRCTPAFAEYVQGWRLVFNNEYERIFNHACDIMKAVKGTETIDWTRTNWAAYLTRPEHLPYKSVLFCMLDDDTEHMQKAIWKLVEPLCKQEKEPEEEI